MSSLSRKHFIDIQGATKEDLNKEYTVAKSEFKLKNNEVDFQIQFK